jgi:hypothetical protein
MKYRKGEDTMAIKQHLEVALQSITSEMERAIATAKDKAIREKVAPNNAEIDRSRTEALNARTARLNEDIAKLQTEFNAERQAMMEASEKKKSDFATQVIETETSIVKAEYEAHLNALRKQIAQFDE